MLRTPVACLQRTLQLATRWAAASKNKTLVPSLSMAAVPETVTKFQQLAHQFMNTTMTPADAVVALATSLQAK